MKIVYLHSRLLYNISEWFSHLRTAYLWFFCLINYSFLAFSCMHGDDVRPLNVLREIYSCFSFLQVIQTPEHSRYFWFICFLETEFAGNRQSIIAHSSVLLAHAFSDSTLSKPKIDWTLRNALRGSWYLVRFSSTHSRHQSLGSCGCA